MPSGESCPVYSQGLGTANALIWHRQVANLCQQKLYNSGPRLGGLYKRSWHTRCRQTVQHNGWKALVLPTKEISCPLVLTESELQPATSYSCMAMIMGTARKLSKHINKNLWYQQEKRTTNSRGRKFLLTVTRSISLPQTKHDSWPLYACCLAQGPYGTMGT